MMKDWITVLTICIPTLLLAQPYANGDSLYVVAPSRLHLRSGSGVTHPVLAKLQSNRRIRIVDHFGFAEANHDTIEGFAGHWVKVEVGDLEGFVFDAYLSRFPISVNDTLVKWIKKSSAPYDLDYIPGLLKDYVERVLGKTSCSVRYRSFWGGESTHFMQMWNVGKGLKLIEHHYWEGHAVELELLEPRMSEVYFLILHLLQPMLEWGDSDEWKLQWESLQKNKSLGFGRHDLVRYGDREVVYVVVKEYPSHDGKGSYMKGISVFFTFFCC